MKDLSHLTVEVADPAEFAARLAAIGLEYSIALRDKDYNTALRVAYIGLSTAAGMSNMAYLQLQVQLTAAAQEEESRAAMAQAAHEARLAQVA